MAYMKIWGGLLTLGVAAGMGVSSAQEVSGDNVKIGVISDMSSAYADIGGHGTIAAVRMAIEDFGGSVLGKPVELVSVDHQNKADVAATRARQWFDTDGVDMVIGLGNTAVHNAVHNVVKEKNKILINTEAASLNITNENCSPNNVHYTYDTYALAKSTTKAIIDEGSDRWYILAVDYVFGQALSADVTRFVEQYGGSIVGSTTHPLNSPDFSSYILTAQASNADVIALANGVNDTVNAIKTANQFRVTDKQKVAGMLLFISDIHALGLESAQNMYATTGFYWDRTPDTREWSERYYERTNRMPTMAQAGSYSATMHYLKAIESAGTDKTEDVMAAMKSMPVNDFFAQGGEIRADGRMVHDMYLIQVKKPEESQRPWDYYKIVATIRGEDAFLPLDESVCPLVKK